MMRVFAVVASFVALNTGGFFAYRALQPEPSHEDASVAPPSEPTVSRPAVSIQPKQTKIAPAVPPEAPQEDSPKTIVLEPTTSDEEKPSAPATRPTRRVRRTKTTSTEKPKRVETQSSEKSKSPIQNSVMEMDDNPYKRGE
jgi:hypothetical protein